MHDGGWGGERNGMACVCADDFMYEEDDGVLNMDMDMDNEIPWARIACLLAKKNSSLC